MAPSSARSTLFARAVRRRASARVTRTGRLFAIDRTDLARFFEDNPGVDCRSSAPGSSNRRRPTSASSSARDSRTSGRRRRSAPRRTGALADRSRRDARPGSLALGAGKFRDPAACRTIYLGNSRRRGRRALRDLQARKVALRQGVGGCDLLQDGDYGSVVARDGGSASRSVRAPLRADARPSRGPRRTSSNSVMDELDGTNRLRERGRGDAGRQAVLRGYAMTLRASSLQPTEPVAHARSRRRGLRLLQRGLHPEANEEGRQASSTSPPALPTSG